MNDADTIQNKIHEIIYDFLNGNNKTSISKSLHPFYDQIENPKQFILPLLKNNPVFSKTKAYLEMHQKKTMSPLSFARLLCLFYFEYYKAVSKKGKKQKCKLQQYTNWKKQVSQKNCGLSFFHNLYSICTKKSFESSIEDILILGSYATHDYTNCSDLDCMVILKDAVFTNPMELLKIRSYFLSLQKKIYYCDPLQHHGFFFTTESEFKYYPQSYMPIAVYTHAVSLSNKEILEYCERASYDETTEQFEACLKYLEQTTKSIESKKKLSAYDWKNYFSSITYLICVYTQNNHNSLYKKDALVEAKKECNPEEWAIVDISTNVRNQWQYSQSIIFKIIKPAFFLCNFFVIRRVVKYLIPPPRISRQQIVRYSKPFLRKMRELYEI